MTDASTLILGLSADPIHPGHIEMVVQSYRGLCDRGYDVARILLVPVYRRNPVGPKKLHLPFTYHHRYMMCGLAAQEIAQQLGLDIDRVVVSDVEAQLAADRERPNYTAETLTALKLRYPQDQLIFLISSELVSGAAPEFGRWYQPERILELAALAICPRPGYEPNRTFVAALAQQGGRVIFLPEVATPDISATELRDRLVTGESPLTLEAEGMLSPAVARYLHAHNFYKGAGPTTPVD